MNARIDTSTLSHLSNRHLDALEEETIFILREVAAAFERPALLFSGGKDSLVMLKWELLAKAKVPEGFKKASNGFYFRRNTPSSPADYYRLEVELKAVDGFFIPLDILTNPDSFFSGAAPYFESLVESAPSRLVQPPSDFLQVQTLQSSMEHCSRAYGGLLRSLLELYGDTVETKARLFDALCSQNPSDRLVKAGCLSLPVGAENAR